MCARIRDNPHMDNFDVVIRKARQDDTPLEKVAEAARLKYSTLRYIKEGITKNPRIDSMRKLAKYYGI